MLESIYDSKEGIPTGCEEHYTERDGKWELQVSGMKTQADVDRVKKSLEAERVISSQRKRDAEKSVELQAELDNKNEIIATFKDGGFDEDKLNQMADERAAGKLRVAEVEHGHVVKELEETRGTLSAMQSRLDSTAIDAAIRTGMKGTVRESAHDIFLRLNRNNFEIIEGNVLTNKDVYGSSITVADFVKTEVAKDPDNFGPTSSGGGAGGGSRKSTLTGDNPFKGIGNLTEAVILAREDPAGAKALAKAAGLNVHDPKFGPLIKTLG